jgi:hypothetical protein
MKHGHIKISRKAYQTDPWWNEPRELSKWEAWEYVIQLAQWKRHTLTTQWGPVRLERGEFLASVRGLAARFHWSEKRVRTWLAQGTAWERLETHRETRAGTVYRIVNYDAYQGEGTAEGTPKGTGKGTDKGTRTSSKQESKETVPADAGADDGNWFAPYFDAYRDSRFGGDLPAGPNVRDLRAVHDELGGEEALARWVRFLANPRTDPQFGPLAPKFRQTHGQYAKQPAFEEDGITLTEAGRRALGLVA